MARRTAQDFVNEVRDIAGGETSETLSDTRILRYVNQAMLAYSSKYMFPNLKTSETITTTSGTAAYSLTAEPIQIDDITDTTNYYHLHPISEYQYKEFTQGNSSSTTGNPVYWCLTGDWEVTFFPTPNGTFSLTCDYYKHTEIVLSPSATSPVTPIAFDDAILFRAAAAALRQQRDFDDAYKLQLTANDAENFAGDTANKTSYKPIRPRSFVAEAMRGMK